jgi:hypothetical protein
MIAATFLAIFFVPLFFKLITERHLREPRSSKELFDEIKHARHISRDHPPMTPGHPPHPWMGDDHA